MQCTSCQPATRPANIEAPAISARSLAQRAPAWQRAYAAAVTDPAELLALLELPETMLPGARRAAALFPLRVPRGFASRMRRGDAGDPLLRQVLPLAAEAQPEPGFTLDAVGELRRHAGAGILHKYHGRALLVTTGACAVHCRYCFRRHFPYAEANAGRDHWRPALAGIEADPSLREVILSGGDPLSLADDKLAALAASLDAIPHLERLRVHSRLPIVLPERVDEDLLAWLGSGRLRRVLVVHANHPNEIDAAVAAALARLRDAGVLLLNQAVLLRGVNDDAEVLARLSERLFATGVMPYYLHLLDRVQGAAHFDVPPGRAKALYRDLAARLPGYLVPHLAREDAGGASKTILGMDAADLPPSGGQRA